MIPAASRAAGTYLLITSFTLFHFCACSTALETTDQSEPSFVISGVIQYIGIHDGCWQITTNNGSIYHLIGDNISSLLKDGIRIEGKVRDCPNTQDECSSEKTVELLEIIQTFNE